MNLQNLVDYCDINNLQSPFALAYVPTPLDLNKCLSAIMVRCGLLTPVFDDPDTFRNATGVWFDDKQWMFAHLIKLIQKDYDPLENYDRVENFTHSKGTSATRSGGYKDVESGKDTVALSGTDTEAHSGTDSIAHSGTDTEAHSGTDTTTNEISAFNASTYQADNKSSTLHGESVGTTYGHSIGTTHGESIGTTYGKSEDTTYGHTVTRTYETDKTTYSGSDTDGGRAHGNIGVTTTQQMFNQELDLLNRFDIYKYIAEQFEKDNMIMLY